MTHQDIDHIGNLPDLLHEADGRAKSYAHKLEKPYIEGERPLLKTNPGKMDDETKQHCRKIFSLYMKIRRRQKLTAFWKTEWSCRFAAAFRSSLHLGIQTVISAFI
ncbi:hypothetical protein VSK92_12555 [Bacillus swezeyi]|uniref:hypothetical protein n=1 Tax=Bacillus swezeyi TaxID=1925020 RepID=UPI0039C636AC